MLPRLEAERALQQANLQLVTEGQSVDDTDRMKFFADLQMALKTSGRPDSYEDIAGEGIIVVYEDDEGQEVGHAGG